MTYLNGIGGIKPKIELDNNSYLISTVNDTKVARWQDVRVEILNNVINDKDIKLNLIDDNNNTLAHTLKYEPSILNNEGDIIQNIGLNIIYPDNSAIVGTVNKQANNSNIKSGDKILSVNGYTTNSWNDLVNFIQKNPNRDINLIVQRDSNIIEYTANVLSKNGKGFLEFQNKLINLTLFL